MNQLYSQKFSPPEYLDLYPINLLIDLVKKRANGCFTSTYQSINYFIYLKEGKVIYATNSLDPNERLERHIRLLRHQVSKLNSKIRKSIRLYLESNDPNCLEKPQDYQAITWSLQEGLLSREQASILINNIINEIFETFLLLPNSCDNSLDKNTILYPQITFVSLENSVQKSQESLKDWSEFSPIITSLYQRPYFFNQSKVTLQHQKISKILRGFNFRQLAAILNQSEISIARKIYPLILDKTILLKEPQSPYNLLPKFYPELLSHINEFSQRNLDAIPETKEINISSEKNQPILSVSNNSSKDSSQKIHHKQWKIVCIDDSPAMLSEINRFLDRDEFSVFTILESVKALVQIIKIQPDLILLDVGMPKIDGYKLCSLIRKYSAFKDTPIIMVTGNKSLIDRAKAKVSGATDYVTKPFTQSDLLDMVFRYLS